MTPKHPAAGRPRRVFVPPPAVSVALGLPQLPDPPIDRDLMRVWADRDDPQLALYSSMAKLFASDSAMEVTTDAVQVLGGYGYTADFPAERYMREAKVLQIVEGTNQIQRMVIARHLVGPEGR